jgi:hypothetical protein
MIPPSNGDGAYRDQPAAAGRPGCLHPEGARKGSQAALPDCGRDTRRPAVAEARFGKRNHLATAPGSVTAAVAPSASSSGTTGVAMAAGKRKRFGLMVWNCRTGALAHLGVARANVLEAKSLQGADADAARVRALAAYKTFSTYGKTPNRQYPSIRKPGRSMPNCSVRNRQCQFIIWPRPRRSLR